MVSVYFLSLIFAFTFSHQNGAISVPDTVEDDDESDDGTPSDDLESAVPIEENKGGAVKFGWIRGVLVSYVGSRHSITARSRGSFFHDHSLQMICFLKCCQIKKFPKSCFAQMFQFVI